MPKKCSKSLPEQMLAQLFSETGVLMRSACVQDLPETREIVLSLVSGKIRNTDALKNRIFSCTGNCVGVASAELLFHYRQGEWVDSQRFG
jgi:formate/nitrite transporter FocA (FNT family)